MNLGELCTKLKRIELLRIKAMDGPLSQEEADELAALEAETV